MCVFCRDRFLSKFQLGTAANPRMYCDHIPGMERKQRRLCQKHPDHMVQVGEGAATGIKECQFQFRQHRWNCSTIDRDASVFGKSLVKCMKQLISIHSFLFILVVV